VPSSSLSIHFKAPSQGYCDKSDIRVSTKERAREGYGLAAQEQAIRAYCQAQGWELVEVYAAADLHKRLSRWKAAIQPRRPARVDLAVQSW